MSSFDAIEVNALGDVQGQGGAVTAYGHLDDHFQLVAHIACQLDPSLTSDEAKACTSPKSSWKDRREALVELALGAPAAQLDLIDIDALDVAVENDEDRWADLYLRSDRTAFLSQLVFLAAQVGWRIIRPAPTLRTSELLRDAGAAFRPCPKDDPLAGITDQLLRVNLQSVAPEAHSVAVWLLRKNLIDVPSLRRLLEEEGEECATALVVGMAYDHLPRTVRVTACTLAPIREEVPLNGVVGPFTQGARATTDLERAEVPRAHVEYLCEVGFLQARKSPHGRSIRMPRSIRQYLEPRAWARSSEATRATHGLAFAHLRNEENADAVVPRHWHAVCSGDASAALESAHFYVSDLRALAYRLSKEQAQYAVAAELYRKVVEADEQDAYAWEYLGFNLERSAGRAKPPPALANEILVAYETAVRLDGTNPLYRGRLLGFRARCGEAVVDAFGAGVTEFARLYRGSGVTWFAQPVIHSLASAAQNDQLDAIRQRWGSFLGRYDRLQSLLKR